MNEAIRSDFPLLRREIDGKPLVYLDSAATSLKPAATIQAESIYAVACTANVHRGASLLAEEATHRYESARREIARFIGATPGTVIFTPNTTCSLAMVAYGLRLSRDDLVLCPQSNHHSNLLPWLKQANVRPVDGNPLEPVAVDTVVRAIRKYRPRLLAFNWVSNVTGVVTEVEAICGAARAHGVLSVVDAAQAAPHLPISVRQLGCDFLAFSGHKLLGPTGTGVLWGREELLEELEPLIVGGGTVDTVSHDGYTLKPLPHRLEPGTPHISGVLGFGAAVGYIEAIGWDRIEEHGRRLCDAMMSSLAEMPNAKVLMAQSGRPRVPIVSIVPEQGGLHPDVLARILSDSYRIMARSGFHCAQPVFRGTNYRRGTVRLSAYLYNTVEEIEFAASALKEILSRMG
jgi:cysteine desulfurase/selenocysteine lyase